jgi:hypothetical protein
LGELDWGRAGLWAAVMLSGAYHGINPGMGWPLAVSAGLLERSSRTLWAALGSLALGHFLSMLAAILPFALLATLLDWQGQIQLGASLLLIGFGGFLLIRPRHPRALARIPPSQLMLWSFAVAIAHGAGLMLVPIYLGLCRSSDMDGGHRAANVLISAGLDTALLVSLVHTLALFAAAGASAWLAYRYLGLKFISRSWFNLDAIWALSLVAIGLLSLL